MILSVFQTCLVYNQACPKLGVPSCLETRLHLEEEKKNQEGKEMGIDYEMAVQTAMAVQTVRSSKAITAEPRASSPCQSVSLVTSA